VTFFSLGDVFLGEDFFLVFSFSLFLFFFGFFGLFPLFALFGRFGCV